MRVLLGHAIQVPIVFCAGTKISWLGCASWIMLDWLLLRFELGTQALDLQPKRVLFLAQFFEFFTLRFLPGAFLRFVSCLQLLLRAGTACWRILAWFGFELRKPAFECGRARFEVGGLLRPGSHSEVEFRLLAPQVFQHGLPLGGPFLLFALELRKLSMHHNAMLIFLLLQILHAAGGGFAVGIELLPLGIQLAANARVFRSPGGSLLLETVG